MQSNNEEKKSECCKAEMGTCLCIDLQPHLICLKCKICENDTPSSSDKGILNNSEEGKVYECWEEECSGKGTDHYHSIGACGQKARGNESLPLESKQLQDARELLEKRGTYLAKILPGQEGKIWRKIEISELIDNLIASARIVERERCAEAFRKMSAKLASGTCPANCGLCLYHHDEITEKLRNQPPL